MSLSTNGRMNNYLRNTIYVAGPSADLSTNIKRWLKDSTQWGTVKTGAGKLLKLITDSKSS